MPNRPFPLCALGFLLAALGAGPAHAASHPEADLNQRLLDAAGHFETITEQAFDKGAAELSGTLATGERAIGELASRLSAPARQDIDSALSRLKSALATETPAAVAVASVEVYRALVNALDEAHAAPREVSLRDYAGFKFGALAKAEPVDWNLMGETVRLAERTWDRLAPRVASKSLRGAVESAIAGMGAAVTEENAFAA